MIRLILVVFTLSFSNILNAEIITDESGNKYITIRSSKNEVLEVLGTPSSVKNHGRTWGYGLSHIDSMIKEKLMNIQAAII